MAYGKSKDLLSSFETNVNLTIDKAIELDLTLSIMLPGSYDTVALQLFWCRLCFGGLGKSLGCGESLRVKAQVLWLRQGVMVKAEGLRHGFSSQQQG